VYQAQGAYPNPKNTFNYVQTFQVVQWTPLQLVLNSKRQFWFQDEKMGWPLWHIMVVTIWRVLYLVKVLIEILPCILLESQGYKLHFELCSRSIHMGLNFVDTLNDYWFLIGWKVHQCASTVIVNWIHFLLHGVNPFWWLGHFTIIGGFKNNFC
jgi:hypothetical protein